MLHGMSGWALYVWSFEQLLHVFTISLSERLGQATILIVLYASYINFSYPKMAFIQLLYKFRIALHLGKNDPRTPHQF